MSYRLPSVSLVFALWTAACAPATPNAPTTAPERTGTEQPERAENNPLLAAWEGPHGGVPAFDRLDLDALEPAFRAGIARHLAELNEIASNPEPPTFDNTIVAMQRTGEPVRRLETLHGVWRGNVSTPEFRAVDEVLAPLLSEYETQITQNRDLFHRIEAVYRDPSLKDRSPDEQRLVELVYTRFAMHGATLEGDSARRYLEIEKRLAALHTQFANNVLADEESYVVFLTDEQLGGLPKSVVEAAAGAAKERGKPGQFAITNTRSSMEPFLTYSTERELRKRVWTNYYSRGDNGDEHDNNALITEILALRDERVGLLGYDDYASWRLQNRMAKTPQRAMALMESVWPAAVARARTEIADMQAMAKAEGAAIEIQPWDYRFYADKVRKKRFALDSDEVKQYLQLDKLREAMFMVARRLFGFEFTALPAGSVPVFHPDVRVWAVTDADSGRHIGLWYLDAFARPGKRSGAWASTYRGHTNMGVEQTVLVSNNSNFVKPSAGQPVLVSWDDAQTFFHEFGHALHALSSSVKYRTLNSGVRDYTEFQSQLLERWLTSDEVIGKFLVHHETGAPMPRALIEKIERASTFNQGFATTEYLASAIMDMKFHTTDPQGLDPDAFERDTLEQLGMPKQIVMRHRSPHFGHVFSGEGYAAGYYGYLWADVLTSDAAEAFEAAPGGFYDEALAHQLVENLFAPRNAIDPAEAYRRFRGRDATPDALMRDRGFADAKPRSENKR